LPDAELKYATFNTEAGWIGVLGSARGLLRTTLPQHSVEEAERLLGDSASYAAWSPGYFTNIIERLRSYFNGEQVTFSDQLDLSEATPFQRQVWEITSMIPYGETRSYSWVAEQIRNPRAARAVGQALGRNPVPIIVPCHRVLAGDGKLCGFGGGIEMKQYLLSLEASPRTR